MRQRSLSRSASRGAIARALRPQPERPRHVPAGGKLTVDTTAAVGFDIYTTRTDNVAFASLTTNGRARFYKITLTTGRARLQPRGTFRSRDQQIVGIAIPPNQL